MGEWRTCRFCRKTDDDHGMVKYEVRHYAHFACYLDAGKPLSDLWAWQIKQFPYRLLKQRGLLNVAAALIRAEKDRERKRAAIAIAKAEGR